MPRVGTPEGAKIIQSLRDAAKTVVAAGLEHLPFGAWGRLMPRDELALFYHVVSDDTLGTLKHYPYKDTIRFNMDMAFCAERGAISYEKLLRSRRDGARASPNGFLITFDDGLAECHSVARNILLKHRVPAVFFITTDVIDNRSLLHEGRISLGVEAVERMTSEETLDFARFFDISTTPKSGDWRAGINKATGNDQIGRIRISLSAAHYAVIRWLFSLPHRAPVIDRALERLGIDQAAYLRRHPVYMSERQITDLAADGFVIGGHGRSHLPLQRMTAEEQEREIVESCAVVRDITGRKRVPFAFPYGGGGIDRGFLADVMSRHEFIELFFDTQGLRESPWFVVNRTWADFPDLRDHVGSNLPRLMTRKWLRQVVAV